MRESSIALGKSATRSKPPLCKRRSALFEKSNKRHLSEVLPMLAMRIFTSLLKPLAEDSQVVVRTRDHLDGDNRADLRGSGRTGVGGGFDGGNVTPEKSGDITTADFFPA